VNLAKHYRNAKTVSRAPDASLANSQRLIAVIATQDENATTASVEKDLAGVSQNKFALDARKDRRTAVKSVIAYRQNVMQEVGLLAIFPRSLILINFSDCCARRLLSLQPDFMAQKCEIEERIEAHHRGFSFIQNFTVNLITLNIIGVIARDTLENIVTTLSQAYGRMFQLHYRMSRTVLYWQTIIVA